MSRNSCTCPASYDHTVAGHLPTCPTWDRQGRALSSKQKLFPFHPNAGRMTRSQVYCYQALLAFQLRAGQMSHRDIARVLRLPKESKEHARRLVARGARLFKDCIIDTVI